MKHSPLLILTALLLLFGLNSSVYAQSPRGLFEKGFGTCFYDSGCRQGVEHEHPNGICGEPSSRCDIFLPADSSQKGEIKVLFLNVSGTVYAPTESEPGNHQLTLQIGQGAPLMLAPVRYNALEDLSQSWIQYTIKGKQHVDEIEVILSQHYLDPPPSMEGDQESPSPISPK